MHRDGESTAHNARGEKPETEVGGLFQDPNDGKSAIRTGFRLALAHDGIFHRVDAGSGRGHNKGGETKSPKPPNCSVY
jgi:hypothetical protein